MSLFIFLFVPLCQGLVPPRPASCPPTSLCVQLCCPPGHIYSGYVPNDYDYGDEDDYDYTEAEYKTAALMPPECSPYAGQINYDPEVDQTFRPRNVTLVGGDDKFSCKDGSLVSAEILIAPVKYQITQTSQLKVFLDDVNFVTYNYEDYCVAFTQVLDDNDYGARFQFQRERVKPTYSVCYNEESEHVEDNYEHVYPVAIFISDIFVFITLCVYFGIAEFRNNLFGRITIGFLINVFLSYFFIGIRYSLEKEFFDQTLAEVFEDNGHLGTSGCVILGYLSQHTMIAMFFWMSAMSIYITRTMLNSFAENKSENPRKILLLHILYAQGSSFFISLVTLIMDQQVKFKSVEKYFPSIFLFFREIQKLKYYQIWDNFIVGLDQSMIQKFRFMQLQSLSTST